MHQASVGWHCPDCVAGYANEARPAQRAVQVAMHGHPPLVTKAIMVMCGLIFAWDILQGSNLMSGAGSTTSRELSLWAAPMQLNGEWYRAVTAGFAHSGLIHIGFNMWLLWQLGQSLEGRLGALGFGTMYVTGILGGSLGALLAEPEARAVGASGAVFALMGAMVLLQRMAGMSIMNSGLGGLLLINILFSFRPGISWGGHIGGLVVGLAMGAILGMLRERGARYETLAPAAFAALGVACSIGIYFAVERAVGFL